MTAEAQSGMINFWRKPYILLTLDEQDGTLINNQKEVQKENGMVTVGAYDYTDKVLKWEREMHDLVFDITGKTLNPDTSGDPSLTAPGIVAFYNPVIDILRRHGRDVLGLCRNVRCRDRYDDNLWATPWLFSWKNEIE